MENTISLKRALDASIIVLSKAQIKRCKKNGIVEVWYSKRVGEPEPQLIDEAGDTVFYFIKGRLRILK